MNMEEHIFFFVLFGLVGIAMEVLFTAVTNLFKEKKIKTMKGNSSLWMFFIYGAVYFIILLGRTYFSAYPLFARGLLYMVLFYCLEFSSGFILMKLNAIPWNYHGEMKYNLKGIICLEFAPLWYVGGIAFEILYLYLKVHLVF